MATIAILAAVVVALWPSNAPSPDAQSMKGEAPTYTHQSAELGAAGAIPGGAGWRPPAPVTPSTPSQAGAAAGAELIGRSSDGSNAVGRVIERVRNGIVRISALDANGQEVSFGSGFVIDATGLVATNRHVIEHAHRAFVKFYDGTRIDVFGVKALDHDGDLAILELTGAPGNVQVLTLADDTPLASAANVIAIGHPHGIDFTTTTGIISAVRTTAELPEQYRNELRAPDDRQWIQTTAAISGGNSGGPLLNDRGEVLGVNTWKADGQNLGFAAHVRHLRELRSHLQEASTPLAELSEPDTQLTRLAEEFNNAFSWHAARMETAGNDEERAELAKSSHPAPTFAAKFLTLADRHRGTPSAFKALMYACQVASTDDTPDAAAALRKATDVILSDHMEDPGLPGLLSALSRSPHNEALDFLRKTPGACSNTRSQGIACFLLANALEQRGAEGGGHDAEIVALLERCVKDFGDLDLGGQTLGQMAEPQLFAKQHLAIGKPAPDIVGKDQDGVEFKLSEYRGKVILLDFWADWCPHCVRMYPHERAMLQTYASRSFAILGVNTDEPERLKQVIDRKQVLWRNWVDGPQGPIAQQWRIDSFPILFVLDHEGIIRFKFEGNPGPEPLDEAINKLLAELPSAVPTGETPAATTDAITPAEDKSTPVEEPVDDDPFNDESAAESASDKPGE